MQTLTMMQTFTQTSAFQYPVRIRRAVELSWRALLLLNLVEFALTWLRVLYGWLWQPLNLPLPPPIPLLDPPGARSVVPLLLTAHLGLFVALIAARAGAFLTPRITITNNGLLMQTALGQRFIPDSAFRAVRSVELQPSGRFVVWVDSTKGLPLQNWLYLLLFNRWAWRGFLLTSDLQGFDDVVARVASHLKQKYGEEKFAAHFAEGQPTTFMSLLGAPFETIQQIVKTEPLPIAMRQAALQMISVALSLSLPLLVGALIHLQFPWGALLLPVAALLEWPLASVFLFAISESYARRMTFEEALRVYPLTQLPRWLIAIGLTLFVVAGWYYLLFVPLFVPAIGLGTILVVKLVEEWFEIEFPNSLLGILVTAIYQIVVYGLFLAFLPR